MDADLERATRELTDGPPGVRWGVCVRDGRSGAALAAADADAVQRIASVGKVLLLVHVAAGIEAGSLDPAQPVNRNKVEPVRDSGLWQHLSVGQLPLRDVAALVGAVSDNLATNVLLREVGLEAVQATARNVGLQATTLHDVVRDDRSPWHPPALATGTAAELSDLFVRLHNDTVAGPAVCAQVRHWLSLNCDLSMVPASFGIDPLAHAPAAHLAIINKTGSDRGVVADSGVTATRDRSLAYAVLAEWDADTAPHRRAVITRMHRYGVALRDHVERTAAVS